MKVPWLILIGVVTIISSEVLGYETAYAPTESGAVQVRTLPAATGLVARVEGAYFDHANTLFRRLFEYIQTHDIAMTVPVEAQMEPGQMLFYVGKGDLEKCVTNDPQVTVMTVPARTVAAMSVRGGYTAGNFAGTVAALQAWLAAHPQYRTNGPAYGVYWNGSFRPWFLKRYEVHIPVSEEQS